jgi:glyoxylase-like metal-dependent hydrolase (beta-lactamase superfamily II)
MKVVLIKKGIHTKKESDPKYLNQITEICSSVTLIKAEKENEKNILVDTGYFGYEKEILENLDKEGLSADDIDYIINTHEHFDHCANNYLFKNAKKLIYNLEWNEKISLNVYGNNEDVVIQDGVSVIPTPGHKEPHCSVVVKTQDLVYVIAGDTIQKDFYFAAFEKFEKIQSARKVLDIADIIIPGHGDIIEKKDFEVLREKIKKVSKVAF